MGKPAVSLSQIESERREIALRLATLDDLEAEVKRHIETDSPVRLRNYAKEADRLHHSVVGANLRDIADEIDRLRAAIWWALGEGPDMDGRWFGEPYPIAKPYWWRATLRKMAALDNQQFEKKD